jgi:hypothetical protein
MRGMYWEKQWHFKVFGRVVCQPVFLLCYPISGSLIYQLRRRLMDNCATAHPFTSGETVGADRQEGGAVYQAVIAFYEVCSAGWRLDAG